VLGDFVYIAAGHNVVIANADRGADYIYLGGTLDVGETSGHTFREVRGPGTFRIASNNLPSTGDGSFLNFKQFLESDESTFEFYGDDNYNIPGDFGMYNNLIISGTGSKSLPAENITIRNNLAINSAEVTLNGMDKGNLEISNQLTVENSARLTFPATNNARTISASNVLVNNSVLNVEAGTPETGTTHNLVIDGGGLNTEGTGSVLLYNEHNNVNLALTGPGNTVIGPGGPVSLKKLVMNKDNLSDAVEVLTELQLAVPAPGNTSIDLNSGTLDIVNAGNPSGIVLSNETPFFINENSGLIVRGNGNKVSSISGDIVLSGLLSLRETGEAEVDGNIRYTNSGIASLEIHGDGVLDVGLQLHPDGPGSLLYTQTGGMVGIGTSAEALNSSYGVFEVMGTGSSFTYTGGSLAISRGSGSATGDILLEPATFNVSDDATLNIIAAGLETITINSSSPLSNLNISGNDLTVSPVIRRLSLFGNFINAAAYTSNDLSLSVKGDFTNSGTFTSTSADTTIFNGTDQSIINEGDVALHHMVVSSTSTLALYDAITVKGNLAINNGNFSDNGNTIEVWGHIHNSAVHSGEGLLLLKGSARQNISGNGVFGNLELNNGQGARLLNNTRIEGDLTLENGIFNIQNHLLSLSENTLIIGENFGPAKMIQSNGSISDEALEKNFASSFTGEFTYPIGTYLKYRPMKINFASGSSGGSVKIYPVDAVHPTINPFLPPSDPTKVLNFYWGVASEISGFTGSLVFKFEEADMGSQANINEFSTAQLPLISDSWLKAAFTEDNINDKTITFNFINAIREQIDGSFTAGDPSAIPNNVPVFTSITSGDWDNAGTWDQMIPPPQGVVVHISEGDAVSITDIRKRVYKTNINGHLSIQDGTFGHNFGLVKGYGTLEMENGIIPPGKWDQSLGDIPSFLPSEAACGTGFGTVQFGGDESYIVGSTYRRYYNLHFAGSNTKTLFDDNIHICNNLEISGSATLQTRANRTIFIQGDLAKTDDARFSSEVSSVNIDFTGSRRQTITGNFTGTGNRFNNLHVSQTFGLLVDGDIDIRNDLVTNGIITLIAGKRLYLDKLTNPVFNNNTFVDGFLARNTENNTTVSFNIGNNGYRKLTTIRNISQVETYDIWRAAYSHTSGANTGNRDAGLETVSLTEHWLINGPGAAILELTLTGTSEIAAALHSENSLESLRIVGWNPATSLWEVVGDGALVILTGENINAGTITTDGAVDFSVYGKFTLGSVEMIEIPAARIVSADATICWNGSYDLEIEFTGTQPFTIKYLIGSTEYTLSGITTYSETVTIPGSDFNTGNIIELDWGTEPGVVYGSTVIVTVIEEPSDVMVPAIPDVCANAAFTIEVQNTVSGFTYQLHEDGAGFTGLQQAGNGGTVSFVPAPPSSAGTFTYRIMAFQTGHITCIKEVGMVQVTAITAPTAVLTLDPGGSICEGVAVDIEIVFTGINPYTFSILRSYANESNVVISEVIDNGGSPFVWNSNDSYTFSFDSPGWHDNGARPAEATVYTYTLTGFTDSTCTGSVTDASIDVWKLPETGPQYHIPNTFGH
jgi:hypothetical protein